MNYRLPGLTLLRTFESAARHLSFKQAAAELCVTPAAVSQHIKALEDWLGVPLFRRMTRALALTEHGRAMLPKVREGFDCFAAAVESTRQAIAGPLTVIAPPSFASHWLVPHLASFTSAHPEVELQLSSTADTVDRAGQAAIVAALAVDPRDAESRVAILYGTGHYPGRVVDKLFSPDYVPVCAPALLRGDNALREPADLARHVLIHDDTLRDAGPGIARSGWGLWLERAGVAGVDAKRGPRFANAALALAAVLAGQGVTLASRSLITSRVAEGSLAIPFDIPLPSPFAYYLVMHEAIAQRPAVAAFRAWLTAETAAQAV
ncbi:transcriptional regulator GcvA [Aromatoleum toluvorans]|uniref:Transcriptional regulator GcvA n=1 Tax=Aromatoleum toluvorans TaxID=92002 RepID=A0ABX1PV86_9RHOO|nr:transcriptional regulator GcvA [Aromatoleum toluvorans]NMG43105.1 transcriptional regulator GcvA [Aromatoleum toluvorans]